MPKEITIGQLKEAISYAVKDELKKNLEQEMVRLSNTPGTPSNPDLLLNPEGAAALAANLPELYSSTVKEFPGHFKTFRSFLLECAFNPGSNHLVRAEMGTDDPELGGFLVPEPMGGLLWVDTLGASVIFNRARREKMKSATQKFPRIVDTDHSSNLFDGLEFKFIAEKATKTTSQPKIAQIELKARTLYAMTAVTNQLLQDSGPSVEMMLRKMYVNGTSWKMDEQIFRGTGAGSPLGILNSDGLITVAKEAGQAASTIVWENVTKMFSQLIPSLMGKAVWYVHPSCIPQIMQMAVVIGTGGGAVMVETGGGVRPIPKQMMGIPVVYTEHCSYLGTLGDIILAVPTAYIVGIRKGLAVDLSTHLLFDKNETAFRGELRIDGQPQINEKLTLRDGTHEVSPFITLAAR